MKLITNIILGGVALFGIAMVISSMAGMEGQTSYLFGTGGAAGGVFLIIVALLVFFLLRTSSPEYRAEVAEHREKVSSMTPDQLRDFIRAEMCQRMGIQPHHDAKDMSGELRIPHGEINTALDNLQIDYHLPISSDDIGQVKSILDVAELVIQRRGL